MKNLSDARSDFRILEEALIEVGARSDWVTHLADHGDLLTSMCNGTTMSDTDRLPLLT